MTSNKIFACSRVPSLTLYRKLLTRAIRLWSHSHPLLCLMPTQEPAYGMGVHSQAGDGAAERPALDSAAAERRPNSGPPAAAGEDTRAATDAGAGEAHGPVATTQEAVQASTASSSSSNTGPGPGSASTSTGAPSSAHSSSRSLSSIGGGGNSGGRAVTGTGAGGADAARRRERRREQQFQAQTTFACLTLTVSSCPALLCPGAPCGLAVLKRDVGSKCPHCS